MKILYIFPHPDDESFGPAAVIHRQVMQGHRVFLYTLTRGGATKERLKLGVSIGEMGQIRYREMLEVKRVLQLSGMKVDDFPDGLLKEMDPRLLEKSVWNHIEKIHPDIIVSYPVHGISGFHDHLVTHAVVKRVFLDINERKTGFVKRLAFITLPDTGEPVFQKTGFRLKHSDPEQIDCIVNLSHENIDKLKESLSCYQTYQATIEESGVIEKIGNKIYFEFFGESFNPPLTSLTDSLIVTAG